MGEVERHLFKESVRTRKSDERECGKRVRETAPTPPNERGQQTGQRQDVTVKRQHAHDTLSRVKQPALRGDTVRPTKL